MIGDRKLLTNAHCVEHDTQSAALIGDFNNWNPNADVMTKTPDLESPINKRSSEGSHMPEGGNSPATT
ncbi:hypothetical protein Fmac_014286 [Flemingia macrophylla]|uniref:Uncharacterized protein n=1 Tax=Flemingia macrophylla TaxID=520843 RepID=A0ABD1MBA1_9FABA